MLTMSFVSAIALLQSVPVVLSTPNTQPKETTVNSSPLAPSSYKRCVINAAEKAISSGGSRSLIYDAIKDVNFPDQSVLDATKSQPESKMPLWDYMASVVDDERIADGKKNFEQNKDFLMKLSANTGVDPYTIAAIWGVETNYGRVMGKKPIINSLATIGCTPWRRESYFNKELVAALRVVGFGHVPNDKFYGSWAGAFGQTQFMPTSFWRLALDGDNDGKKDIVENPKDALASTANFLKKSGWQAGQKWGYEVSVPASYNGASGKKALSSWSSQGFKKADGSDLPFSLASYELIFPTGRKGPAFLIGRNYHAVYSYNAATSYVLAVNILADQIKGEKGIITPWPTDDPGISRNQKREIQTILIANGYDIGNVDGIIGPKATAAISQLYTKNGMSFNGRIGLKAYNFIKNIGQNNTKNK